MAQIVMVYSILELEYCKLSWFTNDLNFMRSFWNLDIDAQ